LKKNLFKKKQTIIKNSKEEKEFINKLRNKISNIDTTNILNSDILECVTQEFAIIAEDFWNKYSKLINITKYSKEWWNKECNRNLATYQASRRKRDWINYKKMVRMVKQVFLDNRI